MAMGEAINSDMAKTLLRKIKGQEPVVKKKDNKDDELTTIISKLSNIQNSLKVDSKQAEESRKILIIKLLKSFEENGLSIKEQKEVLTSVNENLHETMDVLKTLNIGNINTFFSVISNPKLLGLAINKGFSTSNIAKIVDLIPGMISNGFSKVFSFMGKIGNFLANPVESLKSFGQSIVTKTSEIVGQQLKNFGITLWKLAIRPILIGVAKLSAQVIVIAADITTMIIRMAIGLVFWLVSTIVPLLFTIIGFILFTVVPFLVSMLFTFISFMLFTVVPLLFTIIGFILFTVVPFLLTAIATVLGGITSILLAIAPILLVAIAVLVIGILLGYLLYLAYVQIKKFVAYIFSQEFVDDVVKAAKFAINWVWDNVISPVWNALKEFFQGVWDNLLLGIDAVKDFFVDTVWEGLISPAFDWVSDVFMSVWNNLLKPVFDWLAGAFRVAWDAAVIVFDYIKSALDKIIKAVSFLGEGLGSVASSVGGGISKAWKWTTSWFAKGGIVTKPTNAMIGEGGDNEAVIPLNKQGMQFIRDSFQIDDMAIQKIIKNSELFKAQTQMQSTLDVISKDIKQIKFSTTNTKTENKIQNPPEVLVATIKTDKLPQGDTQALFDMGMIEKLLGKSDDTILKKLEEMVNLIKKSSDGIKTDPLLNPGTSPNDSFHDLLKAISTGVIGVRQ